MKHEKSRHEEIHLGTHGEDYGSWMSNPVFYMIGGLLALLSSVVAASTVYLVLVSVSGLAVVIVCFQQFGPSDRLRTSRSSCIRTTVTSTIRKPKPGRLIPPVPNRPSPIWYRNGSTREPDSLEDAAERLQTISEP